MKHHETTTPKSWQCPSDLLLYQKVFSLTKSSLLEIFTARGWDVMIYRGQGAVGPTDLARSEKVWRDSEILRLFSYSPGSLSTAQTQALKSLRTSDLRADSGWRGGSSFEIWDVYLVNQMTIDVDEACSISLAWRTQRFTMMLSDMSPVSMP